MNIRPLGLVMSISAAVYPLMGFFNILIYTRPKVKTFRNTFTELSWLRSFILVVKAGGEVPDFHNDPSAMNVCCCCYPIANHEVRTSELSEDGGRHNSFFSNLFSMKSLSSAFSRRSWARSNSLLINFINKKVIWFFLHFLWTTNNAVSSFIPSLHHNLEWLPPLRVTLDQKND